MSEGNVVVTCRDCTLEESFENLGRARVALDDHELETGHDVDWRIIRVAGGVEQAGADAGVCGIPGCENTDSALLDWQNTDGEK
ncbi:hypothetical protein AUR64_03500 [Haloprofundus marisrubri]|uniref:Uncharacterized protein n=1 Tax=Haloprofundus marisrubri TaxID=1514971 RepID=A0A0W1RDQ7_9EURY|nr:hypothetical protein [Haloprofundus marisrubri]KTG11575.1 hypothetical protein AUR64_03500 [Haloprofundus marisrubri]